MFIHKEGKERRERRREREERRKGGDVCAVTFLRDGGQHIYTEQGEKWLLSVTRLWFW